MSAYTRVEVISPSGRVLVARHCVAQVSEQDHGLTLKVFLDREPVYVAAPERREGPVDVRALAHETAMAVSDDDRADAIILAALQRVREGRHGTD